MVVQNISFNLIELFCLGMFFSFIQKISTIKKHLHRYSGWVEFFIISGLRSVLGGLISISIFYIISDFYPDVSIELKLALATSGAFFSEEIAISLLRLLDKKLDNERK